MLQSKIRLMQTTRISMNLWLHLTKELPTKPYLSNLQTLREQVRKAYWIGTHGPEHSALAEVEEKLIRHINAVSEFAKSLEEPACDLNEEMSAFQRGIKLLEKAALNERT